MGCSDKSGKLGLDNCFILFFLCSQALLFLEKELWLG
jgi:hypothetical protein